MKIKLMVYGLVVFLFKESKNQKTMDVVGTIDENYFRGNRTM